MKRGWGEKHPTVPPITIDCVIVDKYKCLRIISDNTSKFCSNVLSIKKMPLHNILFTKADKCCY